MYTDQTDQTIRFYEQNYRKFGTANGNCQIERQTSEKTGLTDTFSVDRIDPLTISL